MVENQEEKEKLLTLIDDFEAKYQEREINLYMALTGILIGLGGSAAFEGLNKLLELHYPENLVAVLTLEAVMGVLLLLLGMLLYQKFENGIKESYDLAQRARVHIRKQFKEKNNA